MMRKPSPKDPIVQEILAYRLGFDALSDAGLLFLGRHRVLTYSVVSAGDSNLREILQTVGERLTGLYELQFRIMKGIHKTYGVTCGMLVKSMNCLIEGDTEESDVLTNNAFEMIRETIPLKDRLKSEYVKTQTIMDQFQREVQQMRWTSRTTPNERVVAYIIEGVRVFISMIHVYENWIRTFFLHLEKFTEDGSPKFVRLQKEARPQSTVWKRCIHLQLCQLVALEVGTAQLLPTLWKVKEDVFSMFINIPDEEEARMVMAKIMSGNYVPPGHVIECSSYMRAVLHCLAVSEYDVFCMKHVVIQDDCEVCSIEQGLAGKKIDGFTDCGFSGQEKDAHDFYLSTVNYMRGKLKDDNKEFFEPRHGNPEAFFGRYQHCLRCSNCDFVISKLRTSASISIPRKDQSGIEITDIYKAIRAARVDEFDGFICETCYSPLEYELTWFDRLPPILVLHLQRHDDSDGYVHNRHPVEFPEFLEINSKIRTRQDYDHPPHVTYQLCATISHTGNSTSEGRYAAHSLRPMQGGWFESNNKDASQRLIRRTADI